MGTLKADSPEALIVAALWEGGGDSTHIDHHDTLSDVVIEGRFDLSHVVQILRGAGVVFPDLKDPLFWPEYRHRENLRW